MFYVKSCVATTPSDDNCTSKWVLHNNTAALHSEPHPTASTLAECQKACELEPRCVAVDWSSHLPHCSLNIDPSHAHDSGYPWGDYASDHYDLVSRCNITLGECLDLFWIISS